MRLYLGNLNYGSSPTELRAFLTEKGVNVIDLAWPRDNNGLRPFCFVEVPEEDGERIISELDGQVFNSRPLKVSNARPRRTI